MATNVKRQMATNVIWRQTTYGDKRLNKQKISVKEESSSGDLGIRANKVPGFSTSTLPTNLINLKLW